MLTKTPQYMDDLIKSRVKQPGKPVTDDVTGLGAAHNASQARATLANQSAGRSLGLGEQRLERMKDQRDHNKQQGAIGTLASLGGLGFSIYDNKQRKKQNAQVTQLIDGIMKYLNRGQ